ncbi:hypothetical protein Salat_0726900 [Sesamum alatum]|uniref:Transmembrane protein n=1 Tax=Sesamum alatum TaxID=300844 RepID=A0AAE2CVG6_9LAMI|nr:hypothetical protein Salat_0726900 [Sesamum alatum]
MPMEWDPFQVVVNFTWSKFCVVVVFFFVFSFVSIEIPLAPPDNTRYIITVQVTKFSPTLGVSFLALLFMSQVFFWYTYPVILLCFMCSTCISNLFRNFVFWLQAMLAAVPNFNVFIIAIDTVEANLELQETECEFEGADIEAGGGQE